MEMKISEMTPGQIEEYEDALNTFARRAWIKKMLAEILVDMTIAKEVRGTDPMEFPLMLKREIDKIVETWKQRELAKAANGSTTATTAKSTTATSTEGLA